jgi:hypothetical protein
MLLAVVVHPKAAAAVALAVLALVALVIYLPGAIIREVTQAENTPLPPWMGTVRARRARLRVILALLGGLAIAFLIWGRASSGPENPAPAGDDKPAVAPSGKDASK